MIQWPITVAGINCTIKSQQPVIEKFFKICIELGSVSAEITLKRIKKIWELRERVRSIMIFILSMKMVKLTEFISIMLPTNRVFILCKLTKMDHLK